MPSTYNLAQLLTRTADRFPERTALVMGDTRVSYPDLDVAANRVANLLVSRGIEPGDKVALMCPNLPEFTAVYFGILKAGASVVPLNVLLKEREVAYHLADSDAKALFAAEGTADLQIGRAAWHGFEQTGSCAEFFLIATEASGWTDDEIEIYSEAVSQQPAMFETVERDEDDTAVILYTSGTTGQTKGAELRHRNMRDNALAGIDLFGSNADRPDVYLCALPLFHSFGQTVIQNGAIAYGGTVVLQPRFDASAALRTMLANDVSFFAGVPTMYWALLAELSDAVDVGRLAANLRVAIAGGSALPAEIHREFKAHFGVTILEGYGLSETSPIASFSSYGLEPRVGSIGVPIQGVEMKLIDDDWTDVKDVAGEVGEIAIKGHNVMKGYYKRPDDTDWAIKDGWFRSGDLARKDEDGFYYIVDRSKDMIIRGGFNVYPREIEELLMEHPAVSLAAVIGVPHPSLGEEIKAVVVKNAGDVTTKEELLEWSKARLAAYKYPRVVEFVSSLPLTATGKILKRELG